MRRPPPVSTLFPYTTLFRSVACENVADRRIVRVLHPTPHGAGRHIELDLTGRHHPVEHDRVTEARGPQLQTLDLQHIDRKSTRLNSSHLGISYAVFCLKKKK